MEPMSILKWNNHSKTLIDSLSALRENEIHTDATITCENKYFPVHKVVLSSFSHYFKEIFQNTHCQHPVIILKGINQQEVDILLDYMYRGKVDVHQNDLANVIDAAEFLQIKGFVLPREKTSALPGETLSIGCSSQSPCKKRPLPKTSNTQASKRQKQSSNTSNGQSEGENLPVTNETTQKEDESLTDSKTVKIEDIDSTNPNESTNEAHSTETMEQKDENFKVEVEEDTSDTSKQEVPTSDFLNYQSLLDGEDTPPLSMQELASLLVNTAENPPDVKPQEEPLSIMTSSSMRGGVSGFQVSDHQISMHQHSVISNEIAKKCNLPGKTLYVHGGYAFVQLRQCRNVGVVYLKCHHKDCNATARVTVKDDVCEDFRTMRAHNHGKEYVEVHNIELEVHFHQEIVRGCSDPFNLYNELLEKYDQSNVQWDALKRRESRRMSKIKGLHSATLDSLFL